jgi:hypothetical protein
MPGRRQKAAQMHERIRVHLPSAMLRAREHSNRSGGEAGRATAREKNGAMRAGGRQLRHSLCFGTARGCRPTQNRRDHMTAHMTAHMEHDSPLHPGQGQYIRLDLMAPGQIGARVRYSYARIHAAASNAARA